MNVNLFINFYVDKEKRRQEELEFCIRKNIENLLIDRIIVVANLQDMMYLNRIVKEDKVRTYIKQKRPTYNDFFSYTKEFQNDINIISNTDIYFDETLQLVRDYNWNSNTKTCFALSRWDWIEPHTFNGEEITEYIEHYNAIDSQDAWIFYGNIPKIEDAEFNLGKAACDNKIAYLLEQIGYNVINPSKSIRAIHKHSSGIRNYNAEEDRKNIPPPYKVIIPTSL